MKTITNVTSLDTNTPFMNAASTNVLLVDSLSQQSSSLLRERLLQFGQYLVSELADTDSLAKKIDENTPDLLVLRVDSLSAQALQQLIQVYQSNPLPVVVFANQNSPEVVQTVVSAGVSSYVVGEVDNERLSVILNLAVERFKQLRSLSDELEEVKEKLSARKIIEKAKGIIMQQKHLSEEEAYSQMRSTAMNQGQSMAELAERIVSVFELLD